MLGTFVIAIHTRRRGPRVTGLRAAVVAVLRAAMVAGLFVSAGSPAAQLTSEERSAYKGWRVEAFELSGAPAALRGELLEGLDLAGRRRLLRTERPPFFAEALEQDLQRIRLFLARRGYPRAVVTPHLTPDAERRALGIDLVVEPGEPVRVAELSFTGLPPSLAPLDAAALIPLQPGTIFTEQDLEESAARLQASLKAQGRARAQVTTRVEAAGPHGVRVWIASEAGSVSYFRATRVTGAPADLVPVCERTIDLPRGRRYSPQALDDAVNRLRQLGLFRQIQASAYPVGEESLDVVVSVTPREPRSVSAGVGYWTDDFLRARLSWQHRNLFRAGRGLGADLRASRFLQVAGLHLWQPHVFTPRTHGTLDLSFTREREENYRLDTSAFEAGLHYLRSATTRYRGVLDVAYSDLDVRAAEEEFREPGGLVSSLTLTWSREAVDDRLLPARGTLAWATVAGSLPGISTSGRFVSGEGALTLYRPIAGSVICAARLRAGAAQPVGGSKDLLPNRRFFSGGATSMRGFARRKLGPLDEGENPLGGEARFETSLEIRFPLYRRFRGALFVDAGQVWRRIGQPRIDQVEVAIGPSLTFAMPVGPVRGDIGWRVTDREPSQPRVAYHLSIGHSF